MLNCQTYIFQLTSGQLDDAGWMQRLAAAQHRLLCRRCRAFTRNDAKLTHILQDFHNQLTVNASPNPDHQWHHPVP